MPAEGALIVSVGTAVLLEVPMAVAEPAERVAPGAPLPTVMLRPAPREKGLAPPRLTPPLLKLDMGSECEKEVEMWLKGTFKVGILHSECSQV